MRWRHAFVLNTQSLNLNFFFGLNFFILFTYIELAMKERIRFKIILHTSNSRWLI